MRAKESSAFLKHGRVQASDFAPHPLLRSAHLQTILPNLLRPMPALPLRVERVELADGDFVDLGWCTANAAHPGAPLVLLLHGLTGGFQSKYLRGTAQRLLRRGLRCVILQMRGAGPEPNRLARTYHHGASEDTAEVVELLARREPGIALAAAGWSLGGNVLLKYLGEAGAATPLVTAVAACAPFQLRACALRMRSGFSRVYQNKLLRDLKDGVRRKYAGRAAPVDVDRAYAARDFFEFDDAHTALVNGYADAEDYYARAACGPYLHGIRRPTLIVHAADDPFMTPEVIPGQESLSPQVTLEVARYGGHVGFVGRGRYGLPEFWLEKRIAEHLAAQLAAA